VMEATTAPTFRPPLGLGGATAPYLSSPLVVGGTTAPGSCPPWSWWERLPPTPRLRRGVPFPQAFRLGGRTWGGSPSPKPSGLGDECMPGPLPPNLRFGGRTVWGTMRAASWGLLPPGP